MSMYVVGDIHGCYNEWMMLHNRILGLDSEARFILVGDIIDRGNQTTEMLNWMLANIDNKDNNSKYRMVIGNHEFEKIEWWAENRADWVKFDGCGCWDRYGFDSVLRDAKLGIEEIDALISAFDSLPFYIETYVEGKRFIISHGDIPNNIIREDGSLITNSELLYSDKVNIVWNREYEGILSLNAIVVNGHTPTFSIDEVFVKSPGKLYQCDNRYIIDCGLVFSHEPRRNLCALRLEDMKGFYLYSERDIYERGPVL